MAESPDESMTSLDIVLRSFFTYIEHRQRIHAIPAPALGTAKVLSAFCMFVMGLAARGQNLDGDWSSRSEAICVDLEHPLISR